MTWSLSNTGCSLFLFLSHLLEILAFRTESAFILRVRTINSTLDTRKNDKRRRFPHKFSIKKLILVLEPHETACTHQVHLKCVTEINWNEPEQRLINKNTLPKHLRSRTIQLQNALHYNIRDFHCGTSNKCVVFPLDRSTVIEKNSSTHQYMRKPKANTAEITPHILRLTTMAP